MLIAFFDAPVGLFHGLMGVAIGAESVTVPLEIRLEYRLKHLLQGLLEYPVSVWMPSILVLPLDLGISTPLIGLG